MKGASTPNINRAEIRKLMMSIAAVDTIVTDAIGAEDERRGEQRPLLPAERLELLMTSTGTSRRTASTC